MSIWVRSQDRTILTECRTISTWKSGRVVNNIGKEYVHLGDYSSESRAKDVVAYIENLMLANPGQRVFDMPLK